MAQPPLYDLEAVRPMEEELEHVGVRPLRTAEDVDDVLSAKQGTVLVVINSVCGCAAGGARPGVTAALQHRVIPDRLFTVFAGVDRDAVDRARHYMGDVPPSSPCVALFKDGELVYLLPRHRIEQTDAAGVTEDLVQAFERYCTTPGPSVPPEVYAQHRAFRACGSTIPLFGD